MLPAGCEFVFIAFTCAIGKALFPHISCKTLVRNESTAIPRWGVWSLYSAERLDGMLGYRLEHKEALLNGSFI